MAAPLIFFATIAAGGGHVATARAMAEGVGAAGAFRTVVSDYMLELGFAARDRRHKDAWAWMLAHPWSARWGQRLLGGFPRLTNRYHRRMLDAVARRAAAHLGALGPALVVVNHGWLMVALTRAQRRYGLRARVVTFATEPLDASALWAEPDAERVVAPSRPALSDLVRHGVPAQKIDLIGYPVQGAFLHAPLKADARAALGLEPRLTCLVSLGGEGIGGRVRETVRALLGHPLRPFVVVAAGRNAALREELSALAGVRALGFTENAGDMAAYVAACDVVVGKAGPASVLEALAVGRPVVALSYAGLNETALVRFVVRRGLGAYAPQPAQLSRALTGFAAAEQQQRVATAAQALGIGAMTRALGAYLADAAERGFPAAPLRLRGLA